MTDDDALVPFGGRLLRPARPRLRDALSAVTGLDDALVDEAVAAPGGFTWTAPNGLEWTTRGPDGTRVPRCTGRPRQGARSPAEAWETLAARGVIPDAWVGASHERRFVWSTDNASPSDVRACIALASDPDGVAEVEQLARELVQRLAAWLPPRGVRLQWKVVELYDDGRPWLSWTAWPPPGGPAIWAALAALEDPFEVPRPKRRAGAWLPPDPAQVPRAVPWTRRVERQAAERAGQRLDALLAAWARRAAGVTYPRQVTVGTRPVDVPAGLWGTAAGAEGDFTEVLRAIIDRGYLVEWLGQRTLTLVAPDVVSP